MKKKLDLNISIKSFREEYWYKSELQDFCRKTGLKIAGKKEELAERIEDFLKNGRIKTPIIRKKTQKRRKKSKNNQQVIPSSLDEKILDNFTSSKLFRQFFKQNIGNHFHFTVYMMNFIKSHPGITYQEFINEWNAEYERKKDKTHKREIMSSCEYNQYIRDFFEDNKIDKFQKYSLKDAIQCWKYKKEVKGTNKYNRSDLQILTIKRDIAP